MCRLGEPVAFRRRRWPRPSAESSGFRDEFRVRRGFNSHDAASRRQRWDRTGPPSPSASSRTVASYTCTATGCSGRSTRPTSWFGRRSFDTAWRQRERLESDSWLRAWLYRIATTRLPRCARDELSPYVVAECGRRAPGCSRTPTTCSTRSRATPDLDGPVTRETIELAYVAALQLLPPRQRAALILRDVLGWSMRETAGLLDTTIVAANSALQRARVAMQTHLPCRAVE